MDRTIFTPFTTEKLAERFPNKFDLVNHAIHLAKDFIARERSPSGAQNPTNLVIEILEEIEFEQTFPDISLTDPEE